MSEQSFVYVCSGTETADFHVTLPIPFADDEYHVMASLAGATNSFGIEVPDRLSGDRTPSRFRVKTTTAPHSGDRIEFAVFGKLFAEDASIDRRLNALLASGVQNGGWGRRLELPAGRFYLDDTVRFDQVAGQELVGQGARATRLVWRGPSDRPAFDLNRCQDCGIGHLSLEVADSIVNTEKSVQDLSCSGTTVTASATAHGFTVGQVVFISGASPSAYNGRHVVTTVPDANTFAYRVGSTLGTASGTIIAAQAATLLCGVRMYNSATALATRRNVSGVDLGASLLNMVNHPFAAGTPVRLTTTVGLPEPLEVAIDYWVIKVSDDAIALATSLDNAHAGTKVVLTTSGSGTHTVHTTTRVVSGISTLSMQMTVTGHAFVTGSPIRLMTHWYPAGGARVSHRLLGHQGGRQHDIVGRKFQRCGREAPHAGQHRRRRHGDPLRRRPGGARTAVEPGLRRAFRTSCSPGAPGTASRSSWIRRRPQSISRTIIIV